MNISSALFSVASEIELATVYIARFLIKSDGEFFLNIYEQLTEGYFEWVDE